MKTGKVIVSLILAVSLLLISAVPAFAAVRIKESETYSWELVDEEWTCKDTFGKPVRGFARNNDNIYYLNKDGVMKTGWVKYLGDWYYFYKDTDNINEDLIGTLATETWIDNYYVNKTGALTKTR